MDIEAIDSRRAALNLRVSDLCRAARVHETTYYRTLRGGGGLARTLNRLRAALEAEEQRLRVALEAAE